jgi:ATP-binding cassette subfamily F protein uup
LRGVQLVDGPVMLFDGVDLALEARTHACLVGRNGAGKSTLLRMLCGLIGPDGGDRFLQPGTRVGLVEQEPQIRGETLIDHATGGGAARHEAEAALVSFDLDPARPTAGLSGGEARRLALARAFAERPDVLLLDEPTNHLDILAIETSCATSAGGPSGSRGGESCASTRALPALTPGRRRSAPAATRSSAG